MKTAFLLLCGLVAIPFAGARTLNVALYSHGNVISQMTIPLPEDGTAARASDLMQQRFKSSTTVNVSQSSDSVFWFGTQVTAALRKDGSVDLAMCRRTLDGVATSPDKKDEFPSFTESTFKGIVEHNSLTISKFWGADEVVCSVIN